VPASPVFDMSSPALPCGRRMSDPEPVIPAADALPVQRNATLGFRVARVTIGPLYRLLFRLRVLGRGRMPRARPYVLICNHLNWLDPFTLLLAFPSEPRLHFLGNPENLVKNRWHWWVIRHVGGYVPVDMHRHGDPLLFEQVRRCLAVGAVVAIFPEAVYGSREGELLPFKKGFAHFAIEAQVPVLPVALTGTKDLWLRKRIELRVGALIPTTGLDVEDLVQLAHRQLAELLPAYVELPGWKPLRRRLTRLFY
jgi:1-acyl-sn-glycerol-3-phosphate acyltransferase